MTNEPNDKELHDFFRQSLGEYQPEGNTQADWEKLYPRINRKPKGFWWFWGGLGMLICGVLGSIFYLKSTDNQMVSLKNNKAETNSIHQTPKHEEVEGLNQDETDKASSKVIFQSKMKLKILQSEVILEEKENAEMIIMEKSLSLISKKIPINLRPENKFLLPEIFKINPTETEFSLQMLKEDFGNDSTMYQLLGRKIQEWNNSVIVSDFTTSMYPYSTQAFAWMKKNPRNLAIKGTVFFTDCDSLGNQTQKGHNTGQMFLTKERNLKSVLPIMIKADQNTQNNKDGEENDLAALLFAQKSFPDAKHLILIADNDAAPKDMYLLEQIKKPVHVVLCGGTGDTTKAFQQEYFEIANKTNGSLHTLEDDIDPKNLDKNTWLKVGGYFYHYQPRKKKFKVTNFKNRPKKLLGLIWN
jgi:hypothetical protein